MATRASVPHPRRALAALEQRSAETGEPVRHLVATALAELLDVDHQTIFQVSTVGALVEGVYEGAVRIGTLREHGDFGLGTFEGLDGEMVALDGDFFRVGPTAHCIRVDDDVLSPYAMVTHFTPDRVSRFPAVPASTSSALALDELRELDESLLRVPDRRERSRRCTCAACKVPEGTPLVEATAHQREWNLDELRGPSSGSGHPATRRTSTFPATTSMSSTTPAPRRARPRAAPPTNSRSECSGSTS